MIGHWSCWTCRIAVFDILPVGIDELRPEYADHNRCKTQNRSQEKYSYMLQILACMTLVFLNWSCLNKFITANHFVVNPANIKVGGYRFYLSHFCRIRQPHSNGLGFRLLLVPRHSL